MTTWSEVSAYLGRNDLPRALAYAVLVDGTVTDAEEVARGLAQAWTAAEWPGQAVATDVWLMLFDQAMLRGQYLRGAKACPKADLPATVTLYRGAIEEHKVGMSWTHDLERARWFAHRFDGMDESGKVWQVTVAADAVLARFDGRGEAEWVLDTDWFTEDEVTELDTEPGFG